MTHVSQTEADYRTGQGDKRCANCTMFVKPDSCTLVKGDISPQGVCNYFRMKRGKTHG